MFYKYMFILLITFTQLTFAADMQDKEIRKILHEHIVKQYNVGIVVAVVDKNKTQFYSEGKSSKNQNAFAVNEKTLFPIASCTKVFTTLLLANAVLENKIKLTDPAQKYLPKPLTLPLFNSTPITLEDLATHTSGIPDVGILTNYTKDKYYNYLNTITLSSKPGTHYIYSNVIGLLSDALENIYQDSYENLLKEIILQPLHMSSTILVTYPSPKNTIVTGYNAIDESGLPWEFPILASAGAMQSNATDLANFVAANSGIFKTPLYPAMQLCHQSIHSEGLPENNLDFPGKEKLAIGLGWNIDQQHHIIWKNGNFPNYTSFIGFNTQTKRGVVVLTNTGNIIYTDNLAFHILDSKIPLYPLYQEVRINKNLLKRYAGKYHVSDNSDYQIINEQDHLKVQHFKNNVPSIFFNIYPMGNNIFFGKIADAVFTFYINPKGVMCFKLKEVNKIESAQKM